MFTARKDHSNGKEHIRAAAHHIDAGSRRVKKNVRDTTDAVHGDLDSLAHAVGEQVRDFVENASEGLTHARETISDATETVTTKISGNPLMATTIALGVGVLVGAFLRRNADR